ncbi:MAG: ATP phosphoribosyltransferase regulatory subunit, partial [Hansschlegelia sp.]
MSRSLPLPPALLGRFEAAGFLRAEPGVLQPAEPFLDVMGEELRQRMFLTADAEGRELCLRPDFTIPTALAHIAGGDPARVASYHYAGPVFRHGANGG